MPLTRITQGRYFRKRWNQSRKLPPPGRQQEWHGEPGGIGAQQQHPSPHIAFHGCEAEDRAEYRPDTGRPAGAERHPDQHRPEKPDRLVLQVHPALDLQRIQLEDAQAVEPEQDDEQPPARASQTW